MRQWTQRQRWMQRRRMPLPPQASATRPSRKAASAPGTRSSAGSSSRCHAPSPTSSSATNPFRRRQHRHSEHNNLPPVRRPIRQKGKVARDEGGLLAGEERGGEEVSNAEYLTKLLREEVAFPTRRERIKYRPGTLQMSSAESLQHCFVNTTRYHNHLKAGNALLVSHSRRHKLIYRNVPKSASSSARYAMENYFRGEDTRLRIDKLRYDVHNRNRTVVSFVREPLQRFYSSYDEAFYRMGPWMGDSKRPMIAKGYHNSKYRLDKYPYLYEGIRNLKDYQRLYCPDEVRKDSPKACNHMPTAENGTLAGRFEQFVRDYDGLDPFDIHLNLQVANLVDGRNGKPLPIATLYNASDAEAGWREIADYTGVNIPEDGLKVARKAARRFNLELVSDETKRKICRLVALDYCCLNMELPEVCKEAAEDEAVYCAMEKQPRKKKDGESKMVIHSWER